MVLRLKNLPETFYLITTLMPDGLKLKLFVLRN